MTKLLLDNSLCTGITSHVVANAYVCKLTRFGCCGTFKNFIAN